MVQTFRPAFLTLALLVGAAPAFAQGVSTTAPTSPGTQRPVAAAPATPANPTGQVTTRPAMPAQAQLPARPAQPGGSAATTPAPSAPRTN